MKTIYTSYLNNRHNWIGEGFTRIRVCRWVHNGQEARYDMTLPELYPTAELLELETTWDIWSKKYYADVLSKLNAQEVYDRLPNNCVLLCHEKLTPEDQTCHRRLIAKWFEENGIAVVEEWLNEKEINQLKEQKLVDSILEF